MKNKTSILRSVVILMMLLVNLLAPPQVVKAQATENEVFKGSDLARQERLGKASGKSRNSQFPKRSFTPTQPENLKRFAEAPGIRCIVKFREDASIQQITAALSAYPHKLLNLSERRTAVIKLDNLQEFKERAKTILDSIEEDSPRKTESIPSDPYYSSQWALPVMKMPAAWEISTGSNEVLVAVIDSGVDKDHPDLIGSDIRNGWDYINNTTCEFDAYGHGTQITGIIGAQANNGLGISGINWHVAILPLKVVTSTGDIFTSDIIEAIYDAADLGCDVINISLGGYTYSKVENYAITYALSKGCIVVSSAGNKGTTSYAYPASYNGVISVASIDSSLNFSDFSQYNDKVLVTAPGRDIYTTADRAHSSTGSEYESVNGTSFSTAYVSGIAALMSAVKPALTPSEFRDLVKSNSTDLGDPGADIHYGYGLINAEKLLQVVAEGQMQRVQSVSLDKNSVTLTVGSTETLLATVLPTNATNKNFTWASSNPAVATVINGLVTAVAGGRATITVTTEDGAKTASAIISAVNTLTYDGNGHTAGTVPRDDNTYAPGAGAQIAENSGQLAKAGYSFVGWNSAADGTGTDYAVGSTLIMNGLNVTLYAKWVKEPVVQYVATPIVQCGENPEDGGNVGLFLGLKEIRNELAPAGVGVRLRNYQFDIEYDSTTVKILTALDTAHAEDFTVAFDPQGNKVSINGAIAAGTDAFEQLAFVAIALTGSSDSTTTVSITFKNLNDTRGNPIDIPAVNLSLQRGKILNQGQDLNEPTIADAIAGLRYLVGTIDGGNEIGQVNRINMASISPLKSGATGIKPDIQNVVDLLQRLVGLRDENFIAVSNP